MPFGRSVANTLQWRIQDFPQGGAPTLKSAIIFQFFSRKLHENERIWAPGGVSVPGAPLRSANALGVSLYECNLLVLPIIPVLHVHEDHHYIQSQNAFSGTLKELLFCLMN